MGKPWNMSVKVDYRWIFKKCSRVVRQSELAWTLCIHGGSITSGTDWSGILPPWRGSGSLKSLSLFKEEVSRQDHPRRFGGTSKLAANTWRVTSITDGTTKVDLGELLVRLPPSRWRFLEEDGGFLFRRRSKGSTNDDKSDALPTAGSAADASVIARGHQGWSQWTEKEKGHGRRHPTMHQGDDHVYKQKAKIWKPFVQMRD